MIPAKYYYDDDTKTQWNRKKQSKEEARQAKKNKFDPESKSTAEDVFKERVANAPPATAPPTAALIQQRLKQQVMDDQEHSDVAEQENEEEEDGAADELGHSENEIDIIYDDEGNALDQEKELKSQRRKAKAQKPKPDPQRLQELRTKIAQRIQEMREKRKAPGTAVKGAPLNREAILEARRERQKNNKERQALKRKRQEEEQEDQEQDFEDRDLNETEPKKASTESATTNGINDINIANDTPTTSNDKKLIDSDKSTKKKHQIKKKYEYKGKNPQGKPKKIVKKRAGFEGGRTKKRRVTKDSKKR